MARAAFNVAAFPYREVDDGRFEFALLKRADAGLWQGVSAGGEDSETHLEATRSETFEETGISPGSAFLDLDTIEPIRVTDFGDSHLWGQDVYVIPQYWFVVLAEGQALVLSREHTDYRRLGYEDAHHLLEYDGNRSALWELN